LHGWWRAREAGLLHGEEPVQGDEVWLPVSLPPDFDVELAKILAPYRLRLERLTTLIRAFGAEPIYITQHRFDGRFFDGGWQELTGTPGAVRAARLAALDAVTLDVCRSTGARCIDLAGDLQFKPGDYYDALHTTPSGSARIAEFLADRLDPILCQKQQSLK
jgi:hypothetical protein